MRVAIRLAVVLALAMILPGARAADLNGNWTGSFDFNGTSVPLTFHLTVAGSAVTGTVEGLPTTPATVEDGKLVGDTLTFDLTTDYEGQTYRLMYTGKVAADAIQFSFGTDDGSWNTELTATRAAEVAPVVAVADVSGDWSGSFDFQGSPIPLVFRLKSVGKDVTGTVDGLPNSPVEIHEGKVDGSTLTFWLNSEYQGQTYQLMYTGKIAPDEIDFDFGTADGSWSSSLVAKKSTEPAAAAQPAVK